MGRGDCCPTTFSIRLVCLVGIPLVALAVALGAIVIACAPFVITAGVTFFLALYFILRFFEFVNGDDSRREFFCVAGDTLANFVAYGSLVSIISGWDIWWIVVYKVHSLKHHVILELELLKWIQLFMIYSALCIAIMIPRIILAAIRERIEHKIRNKIRLIHAMIGVYECVLFLLAELAVLKHAPNWKYHVALGFHTWKLIQVLVLVLFGIMVINVTTRVVFRIIQFTCKYSKYVVYFAKGLRKSTNFMLISYFLMAMWLSYFKPHFKQTVVWSNRALELVSWTVVCLAIGSMLWLMKKFIVLLWEALAVYDRFDTKIVQAGRQFYFLSILDISFHEERTSTGKRAYLDYHNRVLGNKNNAQPGTQHRKRKAKHVLVQKQKDNITLTIYELQRMAKYFKDIDRDLPQKKYEEIATKFDTQTDKKISKKDLIREAIKSICKRDIGDEDVEDLYNQIFDEAAKGIHADQFKNWVAKAHNNCRELGNTIDGAKEVAVYMNRLLTGFFLLLIVIIWLLVTKIATINLLILVTSPIVAANSIFGDSCKSIFQGIVFAFVMHLFDVGDICVIGGTKVEVRRIGIWKTTFRNVDTNEEVNYQNSILTDMVIIKQNTSLNLNDSVEYCISTATWILLDFSELKAKIDEFIDKSRNYQRHPLGVLVKEVGLNVKIVIHFKHKIGDQDMIYSEFHKKQNKNRAEVLMKVKKLLDSY